VAIDPRKLKPTELVRLLNSTPLGEVISERQLHRHRARAGFRIGDGRTLDLLRYTAWLRVTLEERRQRPAEESGLVGYDAHRERSRQRNMAMSLSGRDIGELPPVENPERKARAQRDFRFFCEQYLPQTFHLPWSDDHLKVVAKIEQAVLEGGLFAMAMPRGSGKALALTTPLPTPEGWTTMGEVQVGDVLFDERGRQCRVTFTTAVMYGRPCYRVCFSDGEEIVCDAEHLWTVDDCYSRRNPLTVRTADMVGRVRIGNRPQWAEHRYAVPIAEPLEILGSNLPIAPYALGLWLGNGTASGSTITNHLHDHDELALHVLRSGEVLERRPSGDRGLACHAILTRKKTMATSRPPFRARLRQLGLLRNKHIPNGYLRASAPDRWALLQGLMDTDGSVSATGKCEITLKEGLLADGLGELLSSLGIKYGASAKYVQLEGRVHGPYRRFHFAAPRVELIFRLQRKRSRLQPTRPPGGPASRRFIVAIDPVPSVPVRCIQVDSPSHLYLAGRKMVPTHNTSLCEIACLWALVFGHREFVALIGADEEHAANMLDSIKVELESNDLLLADFPEVCFPIQALEGIHQRAGGQLFQGAQTHIGWTAKEIVLPTIQGSPASGAIMRVAGITGRIRGMKHKRVDGSSIRPALVLIDDPQTDESARSPSQCAARERILAGAILGLAGPGRKIAGLMTLTVVRPDDLADRLLDREKHPQWQGERTKMIYAWPTSEALWARYAQLWREGMAADRGITEATEFYRKNQAAMDAGADVAWPQRFHPDELSAIQHAMNLKLDRGEAAFWAEYQNEPLPEDKADADLLTAEQIAGKTNGIKAGEIPLAATHVTMFIDVQAKALFWLVAAWESDFSGYVIDYGTEPDQKTAYFTLRDVRRTLATAAPRAGLEGAIYAGLERLTDATLGREWRRDDGAMVRIDRCLIDANWGQSSDVVYQFSRQSKYASVVMPSHGRYVGASSIPFSDYKKKRGDRVGLNWRIPAITGRRTVRHVVFDTNYWKSFIHTRLAVPMGDPGCLSLFGRNAERHRLVSEHLTSEYRVKTEGRGRTVDEWKLRVDGLDNHWLDCLVGAAVAASMQGATLFGTETKAAPRPRLKLSALQGGRR